MTAPTGININYVACYGLSVVGNERKKAIKKKLTDYSLILFILLIHHYREPRTGYCQYMSQYYYIPALNSRIALFSSASSWGTRALSNSSFEKSNKTH